MPKENLFAENEDDQASPPLPPEIDIEDPVAELVGEDKKFKTVADLAKGKLESDAFITRLLEEAKELRDDLKARKNLEELAEDLKNRQDHKPPASSESEPKIVNEAKTVTPEEIETILDQTLTKREQSKKLNDNLQSVKTRLQEALGNDFSDKLRQRARQVDPTLTEDDLNQLAARNPNAFFKLIGIEGTPQGSSFTPPESSVNTTVFTTPVGKERTRSYYDKLKQTDRVKYYSESVRNQMYKDAMRLGEKFEDVK